MNNNILVTGGAGYIGSHTCKALSEAGFHPVTVDSLVYGHRWAVQWGPLIEGDISDGRMLDSVFEEYNPGAVVHFAAFVDVGESVSNPAKYYQNNVCGTLALLESMRKHSCKTIVFSSTCATYGMPSKIPIDETHPQQPINPYGRTKLMIEKILQDYDSAYGFSHIALRYFNAAGADAHGVIGESHNPETHLIPRSIYAALGQEEYVEIYGTDYPTPDGTAIRDYIHVSDLGDAHVKSLTLLLEKHESYSLNLGTGKGHSVKKVIEVLEEVSGREVTTRISQRRTGDPPVLVACPDKAQKILGWNCKYPDIKDIISSAWKWHANTASQLSR